VTIFFNHFMHSIDVMHVVKWLRELLGCILGSNKSKGFMLLVEDNAKREHSTDCENEDNWGEWELWICQLMNWDCYVEPKALCFIEYARIKYRIIENNGVFKAPNDYVTVQSREC